MTWAKRLFIGAASVLVVLAAVPGFLLGTETGLQIIKGALEKAVPGLKIESLSGSAFSLKAVQFAVRRPRPGISRKSFMGLECRQASVSARGSP